MLSNIADDPADLRVMSFNLRVPFLIDGPNYWGFRKQLLVETILRFGPDVLGTQECVVRQAEYLKDNLPGYHFVGAGRNDGKQRGEMCGIFFRADRFDKLDEGHFWLSKTPAVPGSRSWGAWNPRMCSWVKLHDRATGGSFVFFDTHFDYQGRRSRLESARLLRQKMHAIAGDLPVIVTGDFNADEGSAPYQRLLEGNGSVSRLIDSFRVANPGVTRNDGTRHGFRGSRRGPRIDWIVTCEAFQTVASAIDHSRGLLGYPSDHYPVTAILRPLNSDAIARVE